MESCRWARLDIRLVERLSRALQQRHSASNALRLRQTYRCRFLDPSIFICRVGLPSAPLINIARFSSSARAAFAAAEGLTNLSKRDKGTSTARLPSDILRVSPQVSASL